MAQEIQAHSSESSQSLLKAAPRFGNGVCKHGHARWIPPWACAVITTGADEFMREHQWGMYPKVLNLET